MNSDTVILNIHLCINNDYFVTVEWMTDLQLCTTLNCIWWKRFFKQLTLKMLSKIVADDILFFFFIIIFQRK